MNTLEAFYLDTKKYNKLERQKERTSEKNRVDCSLVYTSNTGPVELSEYL